MVETAKHATTINDARILSDPRVRSLMNFNNTYKQLLPVVRKLLRLYLTLPVTSTSERYFFALKILVAYTSNEELEAS